jgi:ankyrin repeat protein
MRVTKLVGVAFLAAVLITCRAPGAADTASGDDSATQVALWDAVIAGNVEEAMAAIDSGADVNALDLRGNTGGLNGRRPLNFAAQNDDTAMLEELLDAGAEIDGTNRSGYTPLHHAAEYGSTGAASLLLERGADATLKTKNGHTALEVANLKGNRETAEAIGKAAK